MFNIGSTEFMLIVVIAVLVIGPKELPMIMYNLGRVARRVQYVKYAFSKQFEDFLREHELNDIHKQVNFEHKAPDVHAENFDEASADEEEFGVIDVVPEKDDHEGRHD